MADVDDADTARELVRVGGELAELAANLGQAVKTSGANIIADLLTVEHAEPLAERCEEAARQLRLWVVRRDGYEPPAVDLDFASAARSVFYPTKEPACPPPSSPNPSPAGPSSSDDGATGASSPSRWKSAEPASDPASTTAAPTGRATPCHAQPVEASDRSSSGSCPDCGGTGVLRWQQPEPQPSGGFILRDEEHPCPRGCGPEWKHPAREEHLVVDTASDAPQRVLGQAAAANKLPAALGETLQGIFDKFSQPPSE